MCSPARTLSLVTASKGYVISPRRSSRSQPHSTHSANAFHQTRQPSVSPNCDVRFDTRSRSGVPLRIHIARRTYASDSACAFAVGPSGVGGFIESATLLDNARCGLHPFVLARSPGATTGCPVPTTRLSIAPPSVPSCEESSGSCGHWCVREKDDRRDGCRAPSLGVGHSLHSVVQRIGVADES
jgi:hypothetical protein